MNADETPEIKSRSPGPPGGAPVAEPTFRVSLSQKLILSLVGSMAVIFAVLGYESVRIHRRNLEEMTQVMADRISNTIKNSTRYSMLQNHRDEVYHIINTIGANPGIKSIRIFNKEGRITYSTIPSERNTLVNKDAEACYACHAQEQPLERLARPDRVRLYAGTDSERVLGLINPIENETACWQAACHAHTREQRVLGVLDVSLSLAGVDQAIARGQSSMIMNFIAATLLISLVITYLIWRMIHRPVRRLMRGTHLVGAGRLDTSIEVMSSDEMGELAASFNRMTADLKRAHEELTNWTHTLEERVEEKTSQLKRAHDQIIQVERMASVGKLSAIVAHEINNPLAGILTYAKLLLKRLNSGSAEPSQTKHDLEIIAAESARCGEIVKSLLQFSRQTAPNFRPCDVNELVQQSIRLVKHKMDLMSVEVQLNLAPGLPPLICDEQQIKQALVALLINSCEAVRPNEGLVEITTRGVKDRESVQIVIRDNGIGMDAETRKQIFEPFFTTKEAKGMGLGLTVVFGIVSRHSGSIRVDSSPGQGASFIIELPEKPTTPGEQLLRESEERSVMVP